MKRGIRTQLVNTKPKQSKQIISSNRVLTSALGRRVGCTDGLFVDGKGIGDEDGCMHVMMKNRTC